METLSRTPRARTKSAIALMLSFTAGLVDIEGYLAIYHIFVAHMTGATVHLGNKLMTGEWSEAIETAVVVLSFVGGSIIGRTVIEAAQRRRFRSVASITLIAEALLIGACVWAGAYLLVNSSPRASSISVTCVLLGLLAAAMGLQTATLTRIGPLTIHTTFVTGMLNKLAQAVAQWIFWIHDEWRKRIPLWQVLRGSHRQDTFRTAALMLAIWVCYLTGSIAGTLLNPLWHARTFYVAIALLAIAASVDIVQPLSIEEEKEQD